MAGAGSKAGTYVALLRAINVGGRNRVSMKDLVALFESAGGRDVVTYIQSGNVVFGASGSGAARASKEVAAALADRLGVAIPVVVRSAAELRGVFGGNPFLRGGADPAALHVMFLAGKPAARSVASLDPKRSPRDRFEVIGREVYLHCPDGIGRSKLTCDYFESRLDTAATVRNWRTVTTLLEMAGG